MACAAPSSDGVIGSKADVSTRPGTYTGYRVITPCRYDGPAIGVTGTGATALTAETQIYSVGQQLLADVRTQLPSVWGGGGFAVGCEDGPGTTIELDDWHEVDPLIAKVGAWLAQRDYALQVGIEVGSIPVPL
jgi:hypothetical protein